MRTPFAVFGFAAAIVGSTPAGAQISNDIVKIGVLSDMSSLYSDSTGPGSLIAAQMAAADFKGKVKGKPIEVIGADHQNKPDVGSSITREWYDTGKVDVIVDVPTSSVALAVADVWHGLFRSHRPSLLSEWHSLDVRYLRARQGGRQRHGRARTPLMRPALMMRRRWWPE